MIYFSIYFPALEHPDDRTICKLRFNRSGPQKPGARGGGGGGEGAQNIFAKVDLLTIDNDSEKRKLEIKYKPFEIPRKPLVTTLLLFTSCNVQN